MSDASLVQYGYPTWAQKTLISGLNFTKVEDSFEKRYTLHYHPDQHNQSGPRPIGWQVLAHLVSDQKIFQAKPDEFIHRCVDISLLRKWERNPSLIPSECLGKLVGAWKSVFVGQLGAVYLPCLRCFGDGETYVDYYILSLYWDPHEPILMESQ